MLVGALSHKRTQYLTSIITCLERWMAVGMLPLAKSIRVVQAPVKFLLLGFMMGGTKPLKPLLQYKLASLIYKASWLF